MKTTVGLIILVVAFAGLLVALLAMKRTADDRFRKDTDAILDFSNQLVMARASLDELGQVNLKLTNNLAASREESLAFSNQFVATSGVLSGTRAALQNAQDQIAGLNKRITGLTAQNQVLDQRASALSSAIEGLNAQIAGTQQKLADSETNNTFLEAELQRQTATRAELEAKFNNLTVVRAQAKKLKEDLIAARRMQWVRDGTDPTLLVKGGQQLIQRTPPAPLHPPHYDLNVEVSSDGAIRVMPASTDAPAAHLSP